jgi:Ribosomal protein L11 methyltransferase (PrmA)
LATARQISSLPLLPPGVLIRERRDTLERAFGLVAPLQPVRWVKEGIVCAPRAAGEIAGPALERCPFVVTELTDPPGWPDPPAQMVAGWYRRGTDHVAAPPGIRELVQTRGDAFGWGNHHTTAMCLEALADLPTGPALDVGCGSGLLTQAWLSLGRGSALAIDIEPGAVEQTQRSLDAARLAANAQVVCRGVSQLTSEEIAGRVILANIPREPQWALRERIGDHPPAAVLMSGLRPGEATPLVASYRELGLRPCRAARRGRWECWVLAP